MGCYVDDVDKNAFMFGEKNKLTLVSGDQAFTQAMVSIFDHFECRVVMYLKLGGLHILWGCGLKGIFLKGHCVVLRNV